VGREWEGEAPAEPAHGVGLDGGLALPGEPPAKTFSKSHNPHPAPMGEGISAQFTRDSTGRRAGLRREFGDFQTPPELASALVRRLGPIGERWGRVLEPTCGRGVFLEAVLDRPAPPAEMIGVELQVDHRDAARDLVERRRPGATRVSILHADIFSLNLRADLPWGDRGPLLILGNPPWVTNAELGRLGAANLPPKRNLKGLGGLDARTGAANFDLGEAVWLKLIAELADQNPTIALLCKTSVARAVLHHLHRTGVPTTDVELIEIDARRWFRASVGACFLRLTLGPGAEADSGRVSVFAGPEATRPHRTMGLIGGVFAADLDAARTFAFALGGFPRAWRQGIKHDAAPVMELIRGATGPFRNGLGETVDVEASFAHPLVKGSDLVRPRAERPNRAMIVTQETLGAETRDLETRAPRLWSYLHSHAERFARRRSSIHRGRSPFSIFGVGPYAFAPFKVAVAGVHRPIRFRALGPVAGRPVVLDDTCYMLPCESAREAAVIAAAGNDPVVLGLLGALVFADAKRPVTKGLLQKIDLGIVLKRADRPPLIQRALDILRDDLGEPDEPAESINAEIDRLAVLLSAPDGSKLGPFPRGASTRAPSDHPA